MTGVQLVTARKSNSRMMEQRPKKLRETALRVHLRGKRNGWANIPGGFFLKYVDEEFDVLRIMVSYTVNPESLSP